MTLALRSACTALSFAALLALMTTVLPQISFGGSRTEIEACDRWPQNRLIVGDLQARHFTLEAQGTIQEMPPLNAVEHRYVLHRTYGLSLDIAEPIALFHSMAPATCVIARDRQKSVPMKVPIFFVGRGRQSLDELKADAEMVAFAPSATLNDEDEFSVIQFHLRKGGSRFDVIRPFFTCGLPGLMLCEGSCPVDTAVLAASLVNFIISGKSWPPEMPAVPAAPLAPYPPAAPPARKAAPAAPLPVPATPPSALAKPSAPPAASGPPSPPLASVPSQAPPVPAPPPFPAAATSATESLVLAFENNSGTEIPAADVLAAEGEVSVEGVVLTETTAGLSAALPADTFQKFTSIEALRRLFPHYEVLSVQAQGRRTLVKMEPLFIYAGDLKIKIADGAGRSAQGCDLSLDVYGMRRAGRGWLKSAELTSGLRFHESGSGYVPALPANVAKNELLIATAQPGDAARLSNAAPGCELEARPIVKADELRSGTISRFLRSAGPILIALLSTDGELATHVDASAIEGFWSSALDLVQAVSDEPWEHKVLARAQSFATSPETHLLQDERGDRKLGAGDLRLRLIKTLIEGSSGQPAPRTILKPKPVERFQLDLALRPLRGDAAIDPLASVQQEALLLVTGGGGLSRSYFCEQPMKPGPGHWAIAEWLRQARKVFALEVWSDAASGHLQARSRAMLPQGAPAGVYLCNFTSAGGGNILLYGVVPAALSDSTREGTFAYLTTQARAHLKP